MKIQLYFATKGIFSVQQNWQAMQSSTHSAFLLCKIACWGGPQSPKTAPWRSWLRVPLERFSGQKPDRLPEKKPGAFLWATIGKKVSVVLCAEPLFLSPNLFHHTQAAGQHWPLPSANRAFPGECRSIQGRVFSSRSTDRHIRPGGF